ncbi:MAG: hypothetical protein SOW78_01140 [Clostridia bacterium]|nr:hypothetical protein [Clostridia bacterium]
MTRAVKPTGGFIINSLNAEKKPVQPVCTEADNSINDELEKRNRRILELCDKILDKIDTALGEVSKCIVKTKQRSKSIEYDDDMKKPLKESYYESESADIADGQVDTGSLKQIVSTLKDVRDIQAGFVKSDNSDFDADETGIIFISDIKKDGSDSR